MGAAESAAGGTTDHAEDALHVVEPVEGGIVLLTLEADGLAQILDGALVVGVDAGVEAADAGDVLGQSSQVHVSGLLIEGSRVLLAESLSVGQLVSGLLVEDIDYDLGLGCLGGLEVVYGVASGAARAGVGGDGHLAFTRVVPVGSRSVAAGHGNAGKGGHHQGGGRAGVGVLALVAGG